MDYLIPTACEVPDVRTAHLHTPSPHTPGGFKGVGEAGTILVPAAIANAVMDALRPADVAANTLPLTPERVLALVQHSPFARGAAICSTRAERARHSPGPIRAAAATRPPRTPLSGSMARA
jgi:hypothetical protein